MASRSKFSKSWRTRWEKGESVGEKGRRYLAARKAALTRAENKKSASQKGWETRWERGDDVGPRGRQYLEDAYGDDWDSWTEAPIFDEEWEIDY